MTPENRKKLLNLISEYGHSLTRIDGERDQMKAIIARVKVELDLPPAHFTRLAVAYHKDFVANEYDALVQQADLFDAVRGVEENNNAQIDAVVGKVHRTLKERGATMTVDVAP